MLHLAPQFCKAAVRKLSLCLLLQKLMHQKAEIYFSIFFQDKIYLDHFLLTNKKTI